MKKHLIAIILFSIIGFQAVGQDYALLAKGNKGEVKKIATTQAEYEFMLEGELDLGRQQTYSGSGSYKDYIGEYIFESMDIMKGVELRYIGTVIKVIDKRGQEEIICIPYLNKKLITAHQAHMKKILKSPRFASAYFEFMSRRSAFINAVRISN